MASHLKQGNPQDHVLRVGCVSTICVYSVCTYLMLYVQRQVVRFQICTYTIHLAVQYYSSHILWFIHTYIHLGTMQDISRSLL